MHGDFIYDSQDKKISGDMSWRMKVTDLEVRLHFWMGRPSVSSRYPVPDKRDSAELWLVRDFHLQTTPQQVWYLQKVWKQCQIHSTHACAEQI